MLRQIPTVLLAFGLSACGASYDCSNKDVHETVLSFIRENIVDALGKTDQPKFTELNSNFKMMYAAKQMWSLPDPRPEVQANARKVLADMDKGLNMIPALKKITKLSFEDLVQEATDSKSRSFTCFGNVRIGFDNLTGMLPIRFLVQPNLGAGQPFSVRVQM